MTAFSGPYVNVTHPAVEALWVQVVAGYRSASGHAAIAYAPGFRDGLARAFSTVTGMDRQTVGDMARLRAAQSPTNSDLGSADVTDSPPSAEPSSNSEEEQP